MVRPSYEWETISLESPWGYLRCHPRHHDRLWFRHLLVCATCSVLDVGASFFTLWEPQCSPLDPHRFGNNHLRAVWRLSLGLGVVPALAVLIWRLNMQNPSHYRKNSMRDTRIPYWLIIKRYWVNLLAISLTWFIYDFITCVCFRIFIVRCGIQWLILRPQLPCKIDDNATHVRAR